jgi:hypothetical protein
MAILGSLLKKGISIRESIEQRFTTPLDLQKNELRKLMISACETKFGKHHQFNNILKSFKDKNSKAFYTAFKYAIPIYDYDKIFDEWWHMTRAGKSDICWPGRVKYFAMSSGTSGDSSKYIPVTREMIKAIKKTSIRQLLTLPWYDLPDGLLNKGILMLGGSTNLKKAQSFYDGDLSGITAGKIPFWFQHFYKPGRKIAKETDWKTKLDEITRNANKWDIGFIVGVPAWIQLLMEQIIEHHQLKNVHDIWPNLKVFVHGGVAFEPYKKGFEKLLGKPIQYIETYLASEGFVAFQSRPDSTGMSMALNNGLFYEFIPYTPENFDAEGNPKPDVETLMIDEVQQDKEYAILLTTCAGAWRYLIGDVIKFTSLKSCEIVITGRTKHFLSLCGEHMSVDNMNQAIKQVEDTLDIDIKEFTVCGFSEVIHFAHRWYIGSYDKFDTEEAKKILDEHLKKINDDYNTERNYALQKVYLEALPSDMFYRWMKANGKEGGQNKFPRVLKKDKLANWQNFLNSTREVNPNQ